MQTGQPAPPKPPPPPHRPQQRQAPNTQRRPHPYQRENTAKTTPTAENVRCGATILVRSATAQLLLVTGQEWTAHVPTHLRKRLHVDDLWSAPKDTTPGDLPPGPIILHLFAGPDTPSALDYTIQTEAPWLTPFLISIDILRDPKGHDLLQAGLYHQLMRKAARGEIVAILGGPNCRTWTILLHMPLPDGSPGHPLRGRHEPDC